MIRAQFRNSNSTISQFNSYIYPLFHSLYNEWLSFMKEYFRQRAKHGFFLENSSSTYAKHTMNMIDLAYAYSGDEELHGIIDDFIDSGRAVQSPVNAVPVAVPSVVW